MGTIKQQPPLIPFSKIQRSILKLLYLNENSDFYTNEIIRNTHSGTGAVQRELKKLTSAGLITIKCIGNQKRYQANRELSYFAELKSIIIKTFGLADILGDVLRYLLNQKIKVAFIYGSFAKQTDVTGSDIDLMLIGEDLTYAEIFEAFQEIEKTLHRKINPTFYSPKEWVRKYKSNNSFVRKVIEQPKIFLIGAEEDVKKFR